MLPEYCNFLQLIKYPDSVEPIIHSWMGQKSDYQNK